MPPRKQSRIGFAALTILSLFHVTLCGRTRSTRPRPSRIEQYNGDITLAPTVYSTHYALGSPPRYQSCCSYKDEGNHTRYTLNLAGWGDEEGECGKTLQKYVRASGRGEGHTDTGWSCHASSYSPYHVDTFVYVETTVEPDAMLEVLGRAQKSALGLGSIPKWDCFDQDVTNTMCNGAGK